MLQSARALFLVGFVLSGCHDGGGGSGDPDLAAAPIPDGGSPGDPDSGTPIRNLGGDVPVDIDWIVPVEGRAAGSPTPYLWIQDLTVDRAGNIVFVGNRSGLRDVDPGPAVVMVDAGTGRPSVTRFDADGHFVWTRVWDAGFGLSLPLVVHTGADGTIYVGSSFRAEVNAKLDFDPGPSVDARDSGGVSAAFITRFAADGSYLGTWTTGAGGTVELTDFAVGDDGAVWLYGLFTEFPDVDPSAAVHVLHGKSGTPPPRLPYLVKWSADGAYAWAQQPSVYSIARVDPLDDGGALVSGTFGLGLGLDLGDYVDLDPSAGVDAPARGCADGATADTCWFTSYLQRVASDGLPRWTRTFVQPSPDRSTYVPSTATGAAIARPDGTGLILGAFRASADLDWGPAEARYAALRQDDDQTFDVFAAGFDADGDYLGATPIRGLQTLSHPADARFTAGASAAGSTLASGWMASLIFPAAQIGGIGEPLEGFLAAFDARGDARWAVGLGLGVENGGGGAPAVRSAPDGRAVLFGSFAGTADLDFTSGVAGFTSSGPRDYYLVGFHERACQAGESRACQCAFDATATVVSSCEDGRFAPCACGKLPPNQDGTFPTVTPDCGACAAGWSCDPASWLCRTSDRQVLAGPLDHPVEVVDDGTHAYYILEGRYPASGPPAEAPAYAVFRVAHDGSAPQKLEEGGAPAHLALDGGYVYWTNAGLHRTASGGDGSVEIVDATADLTGPIAFTADAYYLGRGANKMTRRLRTAAGLLDWMTYAGNVRAAVADGTNLYLVTDGFGSSSYAGLYRLPLASWGAGSWDRILVSDDPRGLVDAGAALYVTEGSGLLRRTDKTSLATTTVLSMLGELGPATRDGDWVYFLRPGLHSAAPWSSEVHRVAISSGAHQLVASSLVHARGVAVSGGRLIVAEHGATSASTDLGAILSFPLSTN